MQENKNVLENDINDVFVDILFAEEKVIEKSYAEGFQLGSKQGNSEGYHLGFHRGAELGSEIGYYTSITKIYLEYLENSPDKLANVKVLLTQLESLLENFPRKNVDNIDIIELADNIRAKFKKFCALMKINAAYPEVDKLSF